MKINKPLNVSQSSSLGKVQGKGSKGGVSSDTKASENAGVRLSGSASFVQAMRDAAKGVSELRPEAVEAAKSDLNSDSVGSESDYQQSITALLMEL